MRGNDETTAALPGANRPAPISAETRQASHLAFLVGVHELIKSIVDLAQSVAVAAINASLVARKEESACAGFRTVAADLRLFSMQLTAQMHELETVIATEVYAVARLQYLRQRTRLLHAAACTRENEQLAARVAALGRQIAELVEQRTAGRHEIGARLRKAHVKCQLGKVAARTARFEAAHGGAMAQSMTEAALEIESMVSALVETAERLGKILASTDI